MLTNEQMLATLPLKLVVVSKQAGLLLKEVLLSLLMAPKMKPGQLFWAIQG